MEVRWPRGVEACGAAAAAEGWGWAERTVLEEVSGVCGADGPSEVDGVDADRSRGVWSATAIAFLQTGFPR